MKYVFVLIFIAAYTLFGKEFGYTASSPLYTHFTYMFCHAGIVHLLTNSLAFIGMFRLLEMFVNKWILSVAAVAVAFIVSFLSMYDMPTVGASAMVYSMVGIFLSLLILREDVKIYDKKKFALFITSIILCLSISALKANSNFPLHIFSLMTGLIAGAAIVIVREG